MEAVLLGAGILAIVCLVVGAIAIAAFVASIVLLCVCIKAKGELRLNPIDEIKQKKIFNLAIWTLIVTIFSCTGCTFVVFPILALVFVNTNVKNALKAGNILAANKEANTALTLLIVGNSIIIGSIVISSIFTIISNVLKIH